MSLHDPVLEQARKRTKELRDFYGHLFAYLTGVVLFVILDLLTEDVGAEPTFLGLEWAHWPILGWGLFVLMHAVTTFMSWSRWEERKTQELYEQNKDRELIHH